VLIRDQLTFVLYSFILKPEKNLVMPERLPGGDCSPLFCKGFGDFYRTW